MLLVRPEYISQPLYTYILLLSRTCYLFDHVFDLGLDLKLTYITLPIQFRPQQGCYICCYSNEREGGLPVTTADRGAGLS